LSASTSDRIAYSTLLRGMQRCWRWHLGNPGKFTSQMVGYPSKMAYQWKI
jgi:hypothetical protein